MKDDFENLNQGITDAFVTPLKIIAFIGLLIAVKLSYDPYQEKTKVNVETKKVDITNANWKKYSKEEIENKECKPSYDPILGSRIIE